MSDLLKEIGRRIKHYRKAKHMTQKELAEAVGVAEITVRQYESGRFEPKIDTRIAICEALDATYDCLFNPTVAAEPKRGKWIDKGITGDWQYQIDGRGRSWHEWQCDQCKDMVKKRSFYCPNCGADMEVNNESN